ncbi:MAG: lytic transglycosylase domain-containing protein [Bryobacterales bacterium]|nr:lytic transglycosylase domain-containing protein [Bryobacterales bacterium]MBV9398452.1 lytic transglycosylase domain-containing protein [Bryobacterales bacterium]
MKLFPAGFFALALPVLAGENAILVSGLRMHVDRHESSGDVVRLYQGSGAIELPAASIAAFEADDYVAPPPPVSPSLPEISTERQPKSKNPKDMVRAAAERSGLPGAFVESVAKAESAFDSKAVSPKGAIGVMQLMPDTAHTLGADPRDPEQNIDAGTRLLRELLIKYDGDVAKALSAYNAGEKAVDRYRGVPPYSETQRYVDRVVRDYLKDQNRGQEPGASGQ